MSLWQRFNSFVVHSSTSYIYVRIYVLYTKRIEYILELNLLEKSVKRPFCCTVSILQVYFTYLCYITYWALGYHFIKNLKLILKEKWNRLVSYLTNDHFTKTLCLHFTNDDFPLTKNQMMFFIHLIYYKVYLTALKIRNWNG